MLKSIRDGSWITSRRLAAYPVIMISLYAAILTVVIATGLWRTIDLGVDFSCFWAAAVVALSKGGVYAYEAANLSALEHSVFVFDPKLVEPFVYPPSYLLLILPFGLVPIIPSIIAWTILGFSAFVAACAGILRCRGALPLIIAFPGAWTGAGQGQNGLFLAACFAGGLIFIERTRWLSGLFFALLASKPQLAMLIPIALVAGGKWRQLLWSVAFFIVLAAAATAAFGTQAWVLFLDAAHGMSRVLLDPASFDFVAQLQSVFSLALNLGSPRFLALAVQAIASISALLFVILIWRREAPMALKAAALVLGALVATPYLFHYDLPILGVALAFLVAHGRATGFEPWEKSALALAWAMPILAGPAAKVAGIVPTPIVIGILMALIARRLISGQRKPEEGDAEFARDLGP